ncbi:MAG: SUMF1/EgtB/PvdO family nonheme iron enzyme [Myxococcales bacterium]|nr:SUMF1/EgtB/PvdO family nonheme iron enzyme [Myxococcales bacterium]
MLCYRCGSHVPDTSESCGSCGQKLAGGGVRQATATFSRRRLGQSIIDGAPFKPGDIIAGRYHVKDAAGAGPLGFVFRAHDSEVDVEVAVKVINPRLAQTAEERRNFAKALRIGRKLSHPHLLRVYEEGEDQERPFFTMQFLEGLTLRKIIDLRLSKGQFFSLREVEPILSQLASALEGAHKVGPHSDLKPENVLVLPDLLKVTDFGLGLAMPRLPFVQAMKSRKADRYLAPEFVEGGELDQRADIYSLGVVLGEMLSGLTPDGAVPELLQRNPELPQGVEGLYRKALNPNPLARFSSASELFDEFAELTRRVSPPPLKTRVEPASGSSSRPKPVPQGPPLQLTPKRPSDKPPPPVPDDAFSDEIPISTGNGEAEPPPDATQPVDSSLIPIEISAASLPVVALEETEVIHSGPLEAELARARPAPKNRAAMWLLLLTATGLATGVAGGYFVLQHVRNRPQRVVEPPKPGSSPAAPTGATVVPGNETAPGGHELAPKATGVSSEGPATPSEKLGVEQVGAAKASPEKEGGAAGAPEKGTPGMAAAGMAAASEAGAAKAGGKKAAEKAGTEKAGASGGPKPGSADASGEKPSEHAVPDKQVAVAKVGSSEPACPEGMRLVPAGSFRMGTAKDDPMMGFDERVLSTVEVAAFCIDQYEYPNRRGVTPTVNVSWNDAKRMCEGKGKRLCTEEEWERACKGPGNARFPYGSTFDPNACNTEDETGEDRAIAPSGRFAKCRSGFGVADLSGNVAEWTSSPYAAGQDKAQKGGAFDRPDYAARCSARKNGTTSGRWPEVGFRCCAELG